MIKKTFLWIVYFLVCGIVIAAALQAGKSLDHCHECPGTLFVKADRP